MIVYNYDADLEVSDTCVRSSLLSWVELGLLTCTSHSVIWQAGGYLKSSARKHLMFIQCAAAAEDSPQESSVFLEYLLEVAWRKGCLNDCILSVHINLLTYPAGWQWQCQKTILRRYLAGMVGVLPTRMWRSGTVVISDDVQIPIRRYEVRSAS